MPPPDPSPAPPTTPRAARTGVVRVGTSGWRYRAWRGDFYPAGLPQRGELGYLAERTDAVELNGSFSSLQRPTSWQAWGGAVPADDRFAVKGSRFVTHLKRLRDVGPGLANFFASGVLLLGPRLGPLLWQLPRTLEADPRLLDAFADTLPRTTAEAVGLARGHTLADDRVGWPTTGTSHRLQHVLEPRHVSWEEPAVVRRLRRRGLTVAVSDNPGRWPVLDVDTTRVRYVRLHGHTDLDTSGYDAPALAEWARLARAWAAAGQDVWVFLDDDAHGRAPHDAVALRRELGLPGAMLPS